MAFDVCVPTSAPPVWDSKGLGGDFASWELASSCVSPWWMSVPASISKRSTYVSTSGLLTKSAGPGSPSWDNLLRPEGGLLPMIRQGTWACSPFPSLPEWWRRHPSKQHWTRLLPNYTAHKDVPYSSAGAIVVPRVYLPPDDLPVSGAPG